jgi:hypothetical protein
LPADYKSQRPRRANGANLPSHASSATITAEGTAMEKDRHHLEVSRRAFLAASTAAAGMNIAFPAAGDAPDAIEIPANYYQHFDADYTQSVPEMGFGGWKKAILPFSKRHTALVLMHAWDCGTREQYPGWHRAAPYISRADRICRTVIPRLLKSARDADLTVMHVVGSGDYYKNLPGYRRAVQLAGTEPPSPAKAENDPVRQKLEEFRRDNAFPGARNLADIERGFAALDFPHEARPLDSEGVAATGNQLFALCKERQINHLIYAGFAINWCLLLSPGGMAEMGNQHGMMCSAIRQATTAVENRETAQSELCKEVALWRVALAFGFVFDLEDFTGALDKTLS